MSPLSVACCDVFLAARSRSKCSAQGWPLTVLRGSRKDSERPAAKLMYGVALAVGEMLERSPRAAHRSQQRPPVGANQGLQRLFRKGLRWGICLVGVLRSADEVGLDEQSIRALLGVTVPLGPSRVRTSRYQPAPGRSIPRAISVFCPRVAPAVRRDRSHCGSRCSARGYADSSSGDTPRPGRRWSSAGFRWRYPA